MNKDIIDQFELLKKRRKSEYLNAILSNNSDEATKKQFSLKSIDKALSVLKKLDFKITNPSILSPIPGIGKRTIDRITEILEKGYLSELKIDNKISQQSKIETIQELDSVIGIGSNTAKKLVLEHGITSIAELKEAVKNGKVKVPNIVQLGLKYYGIVKASIPRSEIRLIEKFLISETKKIDRKLTAVICGSYRRGKPTSGDIDVLLYHPEVKTVKDMISTSDSLNYSDRYIRHLTSLGFILDHITHKTFSKKYMGFCRYHDYPVRRIDIRYMPYQSVAAAMLHSTGPHELNVIMRNKAKARNMKLNEYNLFRIDVNDNPIPINPTSEKQIFQILGMKYLSPQERETFSAGKPKKG